MTNSREIIYSRLEELRHALMTKIEKAYNNNMLYAFNFKSDMIFKHIDLSNYDMMSDSVLLSVTAEGGILTGFKVGVDVYVTFRTDDTVLWHIVSVGDNGTKTSSYFKKDIDEDYSPSNSYKFECSDDILAGLIDDYYKVEDDIIKAFCESIEDMKTNKSVDRYSPRMRG